MSKRTLLDVDGAAEWLCVDERFVRRLVAERRVSYHKVGRYLRFDVRDLDDFLDACRIEKNEAA
jgi:excisionase family DNA binding protein